MTCFIFRRKVRISTSFFKKTGKRRNWWIDATTKSFFLPFAVPFYFFKVLVKHVKKKFPFVQLALQPPLLNQDQISSVPSAVQTFVESGWYIIYSYAKIVWYIDRHKTRHINTWPGAMHTTMHIVYHDHGRLGRRLSYKINVSCQTPFSPKAIRHSAGRTKYTKPENVLCSLQTVRLPCLLILESNTLL